MDPGLGLEAASGLATFLLKTAAEWVVCLLLIWTARSARTRYNLWLALLAGVLAQWVWTLTEVARWVMPATGAGTQSVAVRASAAGSGIAVEAGTALVITWLMAALLAVYIAVVAWRLMGTVAARVRLTRALRHRSAPGRRLAGAFAQAVGESSADGRRIDRSELWVLPGIASPATLGWLRPRVLVPPSCETQDAEELEAVFWHELKHVERRDALWNGLARACSTLLWFHPGVHAAVRGAAVERELACDAAVVHEHPHSRDVYASCLVRFARAGDLAAIPALAAVEMASRTTLLSARVHSILGEQPAASRASRVWRGAVSALLVMGMAATVPALGLIFHIVQATTAIATPVADGAPALPAKRRPQRALRTEAGVSVAEPPAIVAKALPVPHDEALAAEHRAAMDVLNESTGIGIPATAPGGSADLTVAHEPTAAGREAATWSSVAVDAAERMGPLLADHDSDDHH